jgi:osmotically-inducible protein OsmY
MRENLQIFYIPGATIVQAAVRPDVDIIEAIEDRIAHYPPTMRDRHHIQVSSHGGLVTLKGNVKSPNTRSVLLETLPRVEGVKAVNAEELFDDESIRLDASRMIEPGIMFANIEYGVVVLSGRLPTGKTAEACVRQVEKVPGVRRVVTAFKSV